MLYNKKILDSFFSVLLIANTFLPNRLQVYAQAYKEQFIYFPDHANELNQTLKQCLSTAFIKKTKKKTFVLHTHYTNIQHALVMLEED